MVIDKEYIEMILEQALKAKRISKSLRDDLLRIAAVCQGNPLQLAAIRHLAFTIAFGLTPSGAIERLKEICRILDRHWVENHPITASVHFSPGEDCLLQVLELLDSVIFSVDICVFTITDDRIFKAILRAHKQGKAIRIITDDEKVSDPGSDIVKIANAGIPVAIDWVHDHMHHKFAVFDRRTLITGSFNWTRSASMGNFENLLVTDDQRFVTPYLEEFERLWKIFPKFQLE